MAFDPPIMLFSLALNYSSSLFGVVLVADGDMSVEPLQQKVLAEFFSNWLQLAQFHDTNLKLRQNHFQGPGGWMRKLHSTTNSRKAL